MMIHGPFVCLDVVDSVSFYEKGHTFIPYCVGSRDSILVSDYHGLHLAEAESYLIFFVPGPVIYLAW